MDSPNLNKDRKQRKKTSVDLTTMVYGKIPPQAKDLEEAVLGAIMLEKDAFDIAAELLKPEAFYVEGNQRIFRAMLSLQRKNYPIDMLTLVEELRSSEELEMVGGPYAVIKLTNGVVSSANLETHCRIVLQKFLQREVIRISGEAIGDAYEDSTDVFELLDKVERDLTNVMGNVTVNQVTSMDQAIMENLKEIQHLRQVGSSITGIPSGYRDLDAITHGWQITDLIILAARPAVGKTAFALNLARNAAKATKGTIAIFSLEMSRKQLVNRMLAAESSIMLEKITNGELEDEEYNKLQRSAAELSKLSIVIDDTGAININQLKSKVRSIKRKRKLHMIIIDYLQLMSGLSDKQGNREQEISKISRDLKNLAKEINIPIIALSQLSRKVEDRKGSDKMPQLSDLRESGAIEQDADSVLFLYRPEYYDQTANEFGESTKGETHIKIAKNRHGRVGDVVKLLARLHLQLFVNYDSFVAEKQKAGESWKPVKDLTGDLFENK